MKAIAIAGPVAVIGGGYVGTALAARLPPPAIVTTRSGTWRDGPVPEGVSVSALDVTAATARDLVSAVSGARSVVICYAPGRDGDRRALYVDGSRRLVEACGALDLERVVHVSSTSALPDVDGWVDEDATEPPSTDRGTIQRAGERAVIDACERAGLPWIVLRLAGIYGPGRDVGRIYRQRPGQPLAGDGMGATNLIHRDDAVTAILAALALPRAQSTVINVCDDDHCSRRQMYAHAAALGGDRPPVWEIDPPADVPTRGKRVRNERMKRVLGLELRHPRHH